VSGGHEPTPSPSKEGSRTARPVPLLGGGRGGFVAASSGSQREAG
jgi:hypothetical protein